MKKAFRMTALCLAMLVVFLAIPRPAAAAKDANDTLTELRSVGGLSPLEEAIYRGLMAAEERIALDGFSADAATVDAALQHLRNSAAELFHVGTSYTYTHLDGTVTTLLPQYTVTGDELTAARTRYLLALDAIAESVDPDWSDAEICLYLHDYLCLAYSYDTTYSVYDAYGLLTGGTGVCQAYTLVYSALLFRFDIPVTYAEGTADGEPHIWSIVTLGEESYHVDVTWGDPISPGGRDFGIADHENFLKSDAAIDATGHGSRVNHGGIVCDDTTYDAAPLAGIGLAAAFVGEDAYVIADGEVLRLSDDLTAAESIYTVDAVWDAEPGYTYADSFSGLGSDLDSFLYINTPSAILALDPLSATTATLLEVTDGQIFRLYSTPGRLHYLTADYIAPDAFVDPRSATYSLPPRVPPCTDGHELCEYARIDATCREAGTVYLQCTVCGTKVTEQTERLPHDYASTVIPPDYGTPGYTEHTCTVCGHTVTDTPVDALPPPTAAEFSAAVDAVRDADTAEEFLSALAAANGMIAHLDDEEIAAELARLDALVAAYDARAAEINADFGGALEDLLRMDAGLYTPTLTLLGVLILVLRMIFGL